MLITIDLPSQFPFSKEVVEIYLKRKLHQLNDFHKFMTQLHAFKSKNADKLFEDDKQLLEFLDNIEFTKDL